MHNRNRRNVQRKRNLIKREVQRDYERQYREQVNQHAAAEAETSGTARK